MAENEVTGREDGPSRIQDFIFARELSEVYLLLDHVSGRTDKSLMPDAPQNGQPPAADWIEQVCKIGWPPEGTPIELAQQAATLLKAKDHLNGLAAPATGETIAFTLLVAGEDARDQSNWVGRLGDRLGAVGGRRVAEENAPSPSPPSPIATGRGWGRFPPSRISLARIAYPGLIRTAGFFKWEIRLIILLLLVWLVFTCALSWNIASGHAILLQTDALAKGKDAIMQKFAATQAPGTGGGEPSAPSAALGQRTDSKSPNLALQYCTRPWLLTSGLAAAPGSADQLPAGVDPKTCDDLYQYRYNYEVSREDLADWLATWRWLKGISHSICGGRCLSFDGEIVKPNDDAVNEQWAAILSAVLATAVLPLCYGVLGAGAAVVRGLWGKMRDSLISPRDLTLALGQLALGAVIGACIGLFVAPSGASGQGALGLGGTAALSASALSFIAGFGVESVFVALESLIKRIFNTDTSPKKA